MKKIIFILIILHIIKTEKINLNYQTKPNCKSHPTKHILTYFSASTIFKTPDFEKIDQITSCENCPENIEGNIINLSENCKKTININGDKIEPDNYYNIIFGGLNKNPEKAIECFKSSICNENAISDIFITNLINGEIFYLKIELSFPVYLHDILVIENEDKRFGYLFGGKSENCKLNKNCITFWKFEIPVVPIFYKNINVMLQKIGQPHDFINNIMGHSIVYDKKNNRILIYGGLMKNSDKLVYQNNLWSFSLINHKWKNLNYKMNEIKNIVIDKQNSEILLQIEIPESTVFPSLTIKEDFLFVIGGFLNNLQTEKFNYYQKSWKLDLNTLIWTEITPGYFFFNSELNFDLNKKIKAFTEINFPNFKTFNTISDFSNLSKEYSNTNLYISNNNFFIILENSYLFTNKIYFSNHCNSTNLNFLKKIGEKLENECSLNGKCSNNKCICKKNFSGTNCEIKNCLNNCSIIENINNENLNGNNEEISENKCLINFPQSYCQCSLSDNKGGDDCSKKFCLNDCSNKGICDYDVGKCNCDEGYEGVDCSVLEIVMEEN